MQHTIKIMLWQLGAKGVDIVSRGSLVNVYGDNCCYIGPAPDGSAYFWVAPGDARYLSGDMLKQAGFLLSEKVPDRKDFNYG